MLHAVRNPRLDYVGIKLLSIDFLGIKYNCMHFPSIYFLFPLILLETLPDTLNSQSVMKSKSDEALMKAYIYLMLANYNI